MLKSDLAHILRPLALLNICVSLKCKVGKKKNQDVNKSTD